MINIPGYAVFTIINVLVCGWIYWLLGLDLMVPAFLLGCALTCVNGFVIDFVYKYGKSTVRKESRGW